MFWRKSVAFMLVAACLGVSSAANVEILERTGRAFAEVAKSATPAVVFLKVEQTVEVDVPQFRSPFEYFFGPQFGEPGREPEQRRRRFSQMGQGSGFIISADGYILTNSHVVNKADEITVTLQDGREFKAKLIGADPKTEVALVKIEADNLPAVELGDSDKIQVGEWAIAVGNPFGLSESVTAGIISAKGRSRVGIADYENFIQTDAAINPGNSGGPLLNIHGQVIGINTAIYSRSGGYMGIGFAVPINMAKEIKDALIKEGRVRRSLLGVYLQQLTPDLAAEFGLKKAHGALVTQVADDSAASEAGLRPGDIILKLDARPVKDVGRFRNRIATTPPGSELTLTVFRNGKELELIAVTRAMDDEEPELAEVETRDDLFEKIGLNVQDLTKSLATQLGYDSGQKGVLVSEAVEGESAWRSGLRRGMLIVGVGQKKIENTDDLRETLRASEQDGRALLLVKIPRYGTRYLVLKFK
ncbi:DegQ family serine endoprotease [Verrucomicrobiota bacterium]